MGYFKGTGETPLVDRKADRLLETALEADKLGQPDFARALYRQIINERPNAEPAKKAAERLKKLGARMIEKSDV